MQLRSYNFSRQRDDERQRDTSTHCYGFFKNENGEKILLHIFTEQSFYIWLCVAFIYIRYVIYSALAPMLLLHRRRRRALYITAAAARCPHPPPMAPLLRSPSSPLRRPRFSSAIHILNETASGCCWWRMGGQGSSNSRRRRHSLIRIVHAMRGDADDDHPEFNIRKAASEAVWWLRGRGR